MSHRRKAPVDAQSEAEPEVKLLTKDEVEALLPRLEAMYWAYDASGKRNLEAGKHVFMSPSPTMIGEIEMEISSNSIKAMYVMRDILRGMNEIDFAI